jgi:protocatechuate 3,4-dioxygenase beta subunit
MGRTAIRRLAGLLVIATALALAPPAGVVDAGWAGDNPPVAAGTGSISGQITDAGTPLAGVTVSVDLSVYPAAVAQGTTDATGSFHISVAPGAYKLQFDLPGGFRQFYPHVTDFAAATVLTVVDGADTAVTEVVAPHGSVAGQITTNAGAIVPGAYVGLVQLSGLPLANVLADQDGRYTFPYVTAGRYDLTVGAATTGAPRQWAHGHRIRTEADHISVTAGQTSTVDERLLPLGRIRGTFSGTAGPLASVPVQAISQTSAAESVFTSTHADGNYSLLAYPGTYLVKYSVPGSMDQWADQQEAKWRADVVTVVADTDVVLDQQALPTGRISGHVLDPAGNPVAGAGVDLTDPTTDREFQATTAADGSWFQTVWPGTYLVNYATSTQSQWANGQTSPNTAAPVTVTAGGQTVLKESLKIQGSLSVTALDAATGTAVSSFCAETSSPIFLSACTSDGTAVIPEIGAGTYAVTVSDGDHLNSVVNGVQVVSGQASSASARLQHGATITVDLTDAASGSPIDSSVCVHGLPDDRVPEPGGFIGECLDGSSNVVTMTDVKPGSYVFFASVFDGVHGAQWVGPHGGVGLQTAARVVTIHYGDSQQIHIRLDAAGTIAGTVTDRKTGAPVANADVSAWGAGASTDGDGRYQLDGLGPYQWALFFGQADHAGVWSGGGNNRLTAQTIRVRPGQPTAYNISMPSGTTVSVKISDLAGQHPDAAQIQVFDAKTFDTLADVTAGSGGVYTAHILGPQQVKVLVVASIDGLWRPYLWYPDAPDFGHAGSVQVPSSGTKTLNLIVQ